MRAEREVIVSSGAIGSPKLLLQSGIGPADHLRSVGIDRVHDLPGVGSNLQDHLDLFVIAECTGDHTYDKYNQPASCGLGRAAVPAVSQRAGGLEPVRDRRRSGTRTDPRARPTSSFISGWARASRPAWPR